jgi:protoporphyrinogen oxidase
MAPPVNDASSQEIRVAIVGTGLAGLTTAYILQNDDRKRYSVTLFEQVGQFSR